MVESWGAVYSEGGDNDISVKEGGELDKRCFPRVMITGTAELPDIKTDYTGEYGLVFFNNGKPVYKHVGPFRTEGTNYPGEFYLFYSDKWQLATEVETSNGFFSSPTDVACPDMVESWGDNDITVKGKYILFGGVFDSTGTKTGHWRLDRCETREGEDCYPGNIPAS